MIGTMKEREGLTAGVVTDPYTGLELYELSHVWGHGVPSEPGQMDVRMVRAVKHAQHGVLAWRVTTSLHTGTHMNAPVHLIQKGGDLASVSPDRLFGNGAVIDVPKTDWELVTAADLEAAAPAVKDGDIIVVVTGWHHRYSDGLEYYGHAPGLTKDAAEWLVAKNPKLVAVDTPFVDAPLATHMGPHRGGPQMKRLAGEYAAATGGEAKKDFPELYPAHRTILAAGIPTVEQVGGDVDLVKGRRATLAATPWKFEHGDACPVRMVAMIDPSGACRIDAGQ
jgi:kynurenine formamidase